MTSSSSDETTQKKDAIKGRAPVMHAVGRRLVWGQAARSLEERLGDALRSVQDPVLGVDVERGGLASWSVEERRGRRVAAIKVDVGSAAHPCRNEVAEGVAAAVAGVTGLAEVEIGLVASGFGRSTSARHAGLRSVRSALAVTSCKGGVGKSTVAWQLARTLWRRGGRVGILDADVHGPSLPTLSGLTGTLHQPSPAGGGLALPVEAEAEGVLRLASVGFVGSSVDPSAMRGPLSGRAATQLLFTMDWGELDYLVVDLPPGIGDVPLAIFRDLPLDGALVVSTPSRVSESDVERGLGLLDHFKVPTLALVENMATFVCDGCGKRHRIFGDKPTNLAARLGLGDDSTFELPFSLAVRDQHEAGIDHEIHDFEPLARHCAAAILRGQYAERDSRFDASFDASRRAVIIRRFRGDEAREFIVPLDAIRGRSSTAYPRSAAAAADPTPTRLFVLGCRAIALDWSDGTKNDVHALETLLEVATTVG